MTKKCAIERRPTPPGPHQQRRRKPSEYGLQLREKQKARRIYGVLERQFRKTFGEASKRTGMTGETLLRFLELRLDNVVFRLGLAANREQARQLVTHGHFDVNGRKTNIPSYRVRVGDTISVRDRSRGTAYFKTLIETPAAALGAAVAQHAAGRDDGLSDGHAGANRCRSERARAADRGVLPATYLIPARIVERGNTGPITQIQGGAPLVGCSNLHHLRSVSRQRKPSATHGRFEIEPLEEGYGVTLGNALRRILLSSLSGAAITSVKIDGIRHEFSDIPQVREDVTEFVLNLKKVRLKSL